MIQTARVNRHEKPPVKTRADKLTEYRRLTRKLSVDFCIPCQEYGEDGGFSQELARRIRKGQIKESGDVLRWLALHSAVLAASKAEAPPETASDSQEGAASAALSFFRAHITTYFPWTRRPELSP